MISCCSKPLSSKTLVRARLNSSALRQRKCSKPTKIVARFFALFIDFGLVDNGVYGDGGFACERSPIINSRCPRPIGTMESTAIPFAEVDQPTFNDSWSDAFHGKGLLSLNRTFLINGPLPHRRLGY